MNQLIIKLSGEIQSSNFDEWKSELIDQIQATNTELTTDAQFAGAANKVKQFKSAEKALKIAKESAINQAAEIQQLFSAIDEVSEEVRQVRLSLERQIKVRKLEIKEEYIESGMQVVRDFIEEQNSDFQLLDHLNFLDRGNFESTVKGKSGVKGLSTSIDSLCVQIKQEVSSKADQVKQNAITLDSQPAKYRALFQDRAALLDLPITTLNSTIDERLAMFERESHQIEDFPTGSGELDDDESEKELRDQDDEIDGVEEEEFTLSIEILATRARAMDILKSVQSKYKDEPAVVSIDLI
jgi:hypothetical protein